MVQVTMYLLAVNLVKIYLCFDLMNLFNFVNILMGSYLTIKFNFVFLTLFLLLKMIRELYHSV